MFYIARSGDRWNICLELVLSFLKVTARSRKESQTPRMILKKISHTSIKRSIANLFAIVYRPPRH